MATFSISSSIHVNVPPAVAFVYVADLTRHNEWNPGLKVTAISEGQRLSAVAFSLLVT